MRARSFFLSGLAALLLVLGFWVGEFWVLAIVVGLGKLLQMAVQDVRAGRWSLDYIAFLAMVLSLATAAWLAGAVIALMYVGGGALEEYASRRAEESLSALLARLPKTALVRRGGALVGIPLGEVREGETIVVRRGELVPLDGVLVSPAAVLDLANLTGEALPETAHEGAFIKSGSVSSGEAFELVVSGTLETSTYAKIIDLVRGARRDRAPFVRLAEEANWPFTLLALLIALGAYLATGGDWLRVLAVLVIATPCPLIIAAPVAFVGGLSRAASKDVIVKRAAALETIAKVTTVFFDKTGTLTLGEPQLVEVVRTAHLASDAQAISLAAALEYHSIHPLARAVLAAAAVHTLTPAPAEHVTETLGTGIAGIVNGRYLSLAQAPAHLRRAGAISLALSADGDLLAVFHFTDVLKPDAKEILARFARHTSPNVTGFARETIRVAVLTGDTKAHAQATFDGTAIEICAGCSPGDKYRLVDEARGRGEVVAMIGDGLNDAPALARADVGIVFSGTENSAAIEAADAAILGHDLALVEELFANARRSVHIARESVYTGIGLSMLGMLYAAAGGIAPVAGAVLQEGIDVSVILNALRAALPPRTGPN